MEHQKFLEKLKPNSDSFVFIQVGSNEGVMDTDPLHQFVLKNQWKGVLIEPVPKIFEKLKKNYEGYPGLYFENVAISNEKKTENFYVVDESAEFFNSHSELRNEVGGPWGDLVGSLHQNHVLKCKPHLSEKELKTIQVECVTLQDIVDKYKMNRVDLIHIDAEGHDDVILFSIDFKKITPHIIIFEHCNMTFDRYVSVINHLETSGYSVIHTSVLDTIVARNQVAVFS